MEGSVGEQETPGAPLPQSPPVPDFQHGPSDEDDADDQRDDAPKIELPKIQVPPAPDASAKAYGARTLAGFFSTASLANWRLCSLA